MHPYDLIIGGFTLDIIGGLVLVKGPILKGAAEIWQESRTRLGGNSQYVKSALHQKGEAVTGGSLLAIGFLLQIWGAFHGAPQANDLGWINSWQRLALVILTEFLFAGSALCLAWLWARRRFLRIFFRTWTEKSQPIGDDRKGSELDALAQLYYTKRQKQESDDVLRVRLEQTRRILGKKYAGRENQIR